ncbi:MAG: 1-aminocyclopropane-1-carboxylate deaminase/D-cysteine desulfhydrase [Gammaproteobacteria bacterium]|nr:1-aminocyclopropane-1-carboxylate deaminase/D-cysteine desulfhydrase [Gammaproteobacteria bacterium]
MTVNSLFIESPMQAVQVNGFNIHIKRDDLLNHHFSGNKARKLGYFLDTDLPSINKIIGHGSVQANLLYALAALAKLKSWQLDFYVQRIPDWLNKNPTGNYRGALALGANIVDVCAEGIELETNLDDLMRAKAKDLPSDTLFIPEGGRCFEAKHGIKQLAKEITEYCSLNNLENPIVMLPSGTGTTALFLQTLLPFKVLTCACVGDDRYLQKQFAELSANQSDWPEILALEKKYHYGKLYPEFYQIWQQLKLQTGIDFELLYDPLGWLNLLAYLNQKNSKDLKPKEDIIYIHQGGLVGNESMLPRYRRKYGNSV